MPDYNYDSAVIGFGKAGKTLASFLASRGQTVALVEKSPLMYGGTCINVGCIPSKSLVTSAAAAPEDVAARKAYYAAAIAEKRRLTSMLRQKNYEKLIQSGVKIFDGTASFLTDHEIEITAAAGKEIISAANIYINTGSVSFLPPIPGMDGPRIHTSESLMDLDTLPERLVIVGGGYIGLEFASIYAAFGSQVTVLQDLEDFLPRDDRDIADAVLKSLTARGVAFDFGVKVNSFSADNNRTTVNYTDAQGRQQQLDADAILIATGRRPAIGGLKLDNFGIKTTDRGAIAVNDRLQTTAPHIYAMGDVTGDLQFTYVSLDDFRIIRSNLTGGNYTRSQRKNVPYSVFLTPAYSRVGLNETEAKAAGYRIKVAKLSTAAIPKAQVLRQTEGLLKVVIDADTSKILGAMLFCPESYEIINLIKCAMDWDIPYQKLRDAVYTHPTMAESFNDLFAAV